MIKTNFKNDFDVWKNYVNKIGEMLLNDEYFINQNFQKDEFYLKFKEKYENKFIKYKTNERFFIPIIGKISSGKSTFLNSILQGDYLSSASGIDTKLFCILRNNKDCKIPSLYKCELIKEKLDYKYNDQIIYYYFEKTKKEAEGENILKKIKSINQDLKKYEEQTEIKERDINKYFYLLELKIPLFDNNDLGDFFDFVDIPGLNEKGDFYLNNIIPFLVNKCLFSIYIFDVERYENKDTYGIYVDYSKQLNKFYNTNSLYILNKIDCVSDDEKDSVFEKFKTFLKSKLVVNLKKNIILKLNSIKLFNKANAFSDLNTFILHLADKFEAEEENDENPEFFNYIKKKFIIYFKIDEEEINKIFNDKSDNYLDFDEKEYEDISNRLAVKNLTIEFNEDDYKKMKYIFTNKEPLKQSNQNQVYEEIYKAMKNNLNDFFNWENVEELIKTFKDFIEKSFTNRSEANIYNNMCNELIKSFKKELDRKSKLEKTKFSINLLDPFKVIIDSLIKFEPNNIELARLKEDFDSLTYFIYNYRKIRIPLLGGYSTGKSSFLNNLIGQDILPVNVNKCTNRGIIIRHSNQKTPQLFKTQFISLKNPKYWYFKDEDNPICEGYEEVKNKLIQINKENINSEENAFLVLKIPLKLFSELDYQDEGFKKQLENKLELIDFPGLDVNDNFFESDIFSPLMMFSDGFIFVNDCDLIEETGNLNILMNIINQIKVRKFSFSYHSCFFLLHKCDKSLDLDIKNSKKTYKKIFIEEINDENKKRDLDDFNVNKFSSKLYNFYREFKTKYIKDFELFIKYIIDNTVKMEERNKIKNYLEFLNLMNKITKKITFQINRKLAKKNEDKIIYNSNLNDILFNVYKSLNLESCSFNDNSDNFKIIKEIYSNYLYINDNYKFQNQRVLSNAKDLFKSLYKLFKDSYEFTENQFKNYFYLFVEQFNNLFILIDIKIFGNQLKTQLILEKIPGLTTKTKELYNESLRKMKESLSELNNKNENIYNNDEDLYEIEESIKLNMGEFSEKINDYLKSFNEKINLINEEYRQVINSKEIKEKININLITIKYSEKHIDKNTDFFQKYEGTNPFNFFIRIGNFFKKNEKIKENINSYNKQIKSLIEQSCKTFKDIITNDKDLMLRKLEDTLRTNKTEFNGLKNNRNQYERIKNDYFSIIKENNI